MLPDSDQKNPLPSERRGNPDAEKYFNSQFEAKPHYIEAGEVVCDGGDNNMFVATVGSGVLVTMYETELKIGAMAYVFVPPQLLKAFPYFDKADEKWKKAAVKPIESCIAEMKRKGAGKHRIQMRLVGGCKMPGKETDDIGTKNYIFVREYITRKGLALMNEDLGGPYIRRVHFFPSTGRAVRFILRRDGDFKSMNDIESKLNFKN